VPYIITTHTTTYAPSASGQWGATQRRTSQSSRAFATLDEAWEKLPPGIPDTTLVRELFALEENGRCAIGPLPDGTVIEVASVDWLDIYAALDASSDDFDGGGVDAEPAILDAYNANKGAGA
jgi:hypothetical protein